MKPETPLRCLVLTSSVTSRNGYGVLSRSILSALNETGDVKADVFTSDEKRRFAFGRRSLRSEFLASRPRWWRLLVLHDVFLLLLLARKKYDVILVFVEHFAAAAWLYSKFRRTPCVLTQNGTYAVELPRLVPYFGQVAAKVARLLPISGYTAKRMREEGVVGRAEIVTLGADTALFRPCAQGPRRRDIVFVGNLKARKGIDFLITAMERALATVPDLRLKVVGKLDTTAPEYVALADKISRRNLPIDFVGSIDDEQLARLYSEARLNALPSHSAPFFFEGFGLIHVEANACGTLTVGTLESGNEDAIREGFGYLVRFGDVEALAQVIIDAMTVEPYPDLISKGAPRTWTDVGRDYLGILIKVVEEQKGKKG